MKMVEDQEMQTPQKGLWEEQNLGRGTHGCSDNRTPKCEDTAEVSGDNGLPDSGWVGDLQARADGRLCLEALYGVGDFQHVHFNKRVGLLLERLFPGEVHRRTLKVDRIKIKDALPISGVHVRLITGTYTAKRKENAYCISQWMEINSGWRCPGLINRMAFKDALTYQSAGLKIYKTTQVSMQIRKYTYRKRKAYEFSRLPALEQEKIKKTRQDKARRLRQKRGSERRVSRADPRN